MSWFTWIIILQTISTTFSAALEEERENRGNIRKKNDLFHVNHSVNQLHLNFKLVKIDHMNPLKPFHTIQVHFMAMLNKLLR